MLNSGNALGKLTCCALCCAAAAIAVAAPPSGNSPGGLLGRASGLLTATPPRSPAGHLDFQRLDLRAPETLAGGHGSSNGDSAAVFPSAKRAQAGAASAAEQDLPGTANLAQLRMESKVQELERRVPREGLPVARLWETKTALLHVGLNPRGKPGLWLIQKVP